FFYCSVSLKSPSATQRFGCERRIIYFAHKFRARAMSAFHPFRTLTLGPFSVSPAYRKQLYFRFRTRCLPIKTHAKLRKTLTFYAIALQRSGVRFPSAPPAFARRSFGWLASNGVSEWPAALH